MEELQIAYLKCLDHVWGFLPDVLRQGKTTRLVVGQEVSKN